jgi:hypothetical protein
MAAVEKLEDGWMGESSAASQEGVLELSKELKMPTPFNATPTSSEEHETSLGGEADSTG